MVHQAVKDRRAHGVVSEISAPVLHDAIGRDDDAAVQFVALMDQGLQQSASFVGDGASEEQVVEHEQIAVKDAPQSSFALSGGAEGISIEEPVGLEILDLVALQDGLVGDRLGHVRFSSGGLANEQSVFAGGDKLQRVQLEAGLTRQFGIEGPVELRERELLVKPGLLVAASDETGLTTIEFVLQEQAEGLEERLAGALGLQDAGLERVARMPDSRNCRRQRSISGKVMVIPNDLLWRLKG